MAASTAAPTVAGIYARAPHIGPLIDAGHYEIHLIVHQKQPQPGAVRGRTVDGVTRQAVFPEGLCPQRGLNGEGMAGGTAFPIRRGNDHLMPRLLQRIAQGSQPRGPISVVVYQEYPHIFSPFAVFSKGPPRL